MTTLTSRSRTTTNGVPGEWHVSGDVWETPIVRSVSKGGPNKGYPDMLNALNLTTEIVGDTKDITYPTIGVLRAEKQQSPGLYIIQEYQGFPPKPGNYPASEPDPVDLMGTLVSGLGGNIYEAQAGFSGGVFLGEIREVIQMFRNPLSGVTKLAQNLLKFYKAWNKRWAYRMYIQGLQRKYWIAKDRAVDDILWRQYANTNDRCRRIARQAMYEWDRAYLEYTYGLKPLIQDTVDLTLRLMDIMNEKEFEVVNFRNGDSSHEEYSWTQNLGSYVTWNVEGDLEMEANGEGKAMIRVLPVGPTAVDFLQQAFGLRALDFIPTIWQLIPFSFTLDYFSNLSDFLNSTFCENGTIVWSYVGYECTVKGTLVYTAEPRNNPDVFESELTPLIINRRHVERRKFNPQDASFGWNLPTWKQVTNLAVLFDALRGIR